jgi:hypothetical protein
MWECLRVGMDLGLGMRRGRGRRCCKPLLDLIDSWCLGMNQDDDEHGHEKGKGKTVGVSEFFQANPFRQVVTGTYR